MKNTVGAFLDKNKCHFSVWAPFKNSVQLLVNEAEKVPMQSDEFGYWKAEVDDVRAGDLYQFVLDDELTRPDPASLSQPQGVHGPSQIVNRRYKWNDEGWKGIPMQNMIIYELHVGTFTDKGDFEGVIEKLDYLHTLGINTIELMPVAQFPGGRNWGYDGVYPFAVQDTYGGPQGLKKLVDACHQKGIAVILDVVYNHMGPEGNYLNDYGPYFTDKYQTPWGKAINFDDAHSDQVRSFFIQNTLMWLDEFHIDGLRLDAIHAIKDLGARHFLLELSEAVKALEEKKLRHMPLIGECDLNDSKFISPAATGGYGLSGQWIDEFHHALHALLTGEQGGYYADFGSFEHMLKAYRDTYVYDGVYSEHRKKTFGNSAKNNPFDQFVVFSQNHDQVGNRMLGDRLSSLISYEQLKLSAVAVLTSPYVPMLFMGEEYAEEKPFQYFVSHTDPDLVEAVRKGRKAEFAYFQKEGQVTPDPQSEDTFRHSTLSWEMEKPLRRSMLSLYQELIALRKNTPALRVSTRKHSQFLTKNKVICMRRHSLDNDLVYIMMNFGSEKQKFDIDAKDSFIFNRKLDTADTKWQGSGATSQEQYQGNAAVEIAPYASVILVRQQ